MSLSFPLSPPQILSFTETATSISELHQAHAHMLKTGLIHEPFAASRLITAAATKVGAVSHAHSIFDFMPNPNPYVYNTIIRAYANSATPDNALHVYNQMLLDHVVPDNYTFTFSLKASANLRGADDEGKQIHGQVVKNGSGCDAYVSNTLIHMYANSGDFVVARSVLDRMPATDAISWNAMLSAYVDLGLVDSARQLFDEMPERNTESWNFMVSGYVSAGMVQEARKVFDEMPAKNLVSWNAMITGYAQANQFEESLILFKEMQDTDVNPDNCTLVNVLSSCARVGALRQGKWLHSYIDKNKISINGFLATALVDMYSKCGCIEKALEVFQNTSSKDVSTWNSIIAGLSTHGFAQHALQIFSDMLQNGFKPNEVTFVSVLAACSRAGLLKEGCKMFDVMVSTHGIKPTVEHYGCMVDLLGRSGLLKEAEEVVRLMPMKATPVIWETLLSACRSHGKFEMAASIARELLEMDPEDSSGYVQLSNVHASEGRWDDVANARSRMKAQGVRKEPGCSMIEIDGVVREFLAGEGVHT